MKVTSKHNLEDLEDAYKLATEKLKFDFKKEVRKNYKNYYIPKKYLKVLDLFGSNKILDESNLDSSNYFDIYLFIIRLGNPNIRFKYEDVITINIGEI